MELWGEALGISKLTYVNATTWKLRATLWSPVPYHDLAQFGADDDAAESHSESTR